MPGVAQDMLYGICVNAFVDILSQYLRRRAAWLQRAGSIPLHMGCLVQARAPRRGKFLLQNFRFLIRDATSLFPGHHPRCTCLGVLEGRWNTSRVLGCSIRQPPLSLRLPRRSSMKRDVRMGQCNILVSHANMTTACSMVTRGAFTLYLGM